MAQFVSLDDDVREILDTASAAYHANRRPQTLRSWACKQNGPLIPIRLHGRLGWRKLDIVKLVRGEKNDVKLGQKNTQNVSDGADSNNSARGVK